MVILFPLSSAPSCLALIEETFSPLLEAAALSNGLDETSSLDSLQEY